MSPIGWFSAGRTALMVAWWVLWWMCTVSWVRVNSLSSRAAGARCRLAARWGRVSSRYVGVLGCVTSTAVTAST
ncbi:hypothetical protein BJP25_12160 [Actinokineospora bangkokensis]|uniref:Uncharacterized protein n=1 Tax=Actinokineospora bangkokensis TaxID=1193682 RepID=A0A1Q9LR70_9PSEU|nr:hypothetical protein BJP25_12160 [Actinokineospora bangkokensis]